MEIDDKKGTKQVIPFQTTKEKNALAFAWIDDLDYMCDWGEVVFSQPFGVTSQGYEGTNLALPPLIGTEKIKLTIGDDLGSDQGNLELEMDIFKIQEKPSSATARYMTTRLVLFNSKMTALMRPEKNRSFSKPYSEVATLIAKGAGFPTLYIEPTQGTKTVKQLYWNDAQLLSDMVSSSVGSQGSVPYFWHVSGDNFHYHSYEYPQQGETHTISTIYGHHIKPPTTSESDIEKFRRMQVLDWAVEVSPKTSLFSGASGITAGGSSFDSGYLLKHKTGTEVYKGGRQLDRQMPTEDTEMDKEARYIYTGGGVEDLEAIIQNRIAMRQKNMVKLRVLMRGKAERRAAKIVQFEHQKMIGSGTEAKYSGKYLVHRVAHIYMNGEYYNQMTLTRAGYNL